ncbi:IclR family transcriptional regulator [Salinisphaera japonica]|uniref:Oxidoreductase n=1 Tax=Salinisphaera japonica YTM-1 TaxID=1209778 RepID=A0A423Q0C9_9GAMM|nr:IclR family transcriptional regulator [Salinisphaera japonica]ROO31441.1 oxidoreductase [Salinisphaera japonica YTM-1]
MAKRKDTSEPAQATGKPPQQISALARGLELLRCFGNGAEYLGNAELADRTGIPRPTVSRITATLTQLGYLLYIADLERYRLGPGVMDLGYRYLASEGVSTLARPFMQELAEATDCMIALGAPEATHITYIQCCQGSGPLILRMQTGSRVPIGLSAMGRALLAGMTPAQRVPYLEAIQRDNPSDWPAIEDSLEAAYAEYAAYGFCTSQAEWSRDISGVGVPLYVEAEQRMLAFNCGGAAQRLTQQVLTDNLGPRLKTLVDQVEALLTGQGTTSAQSHRG